MENKHSINNVSDRWQKAEVGSVFSYIRTHAISRENLVDGTANTVGIGNIHYGDIHSTYNSTSIDLRRISVPNVKDVDFSPNKGDLLKDGDLIMADASEDYEGVGITVSIHGLENKKIVGGLHTFVLRDTNNKTDERYRQYIFRNPEIRNGLQKIANGVSVYGISKTSLSKIVLSLPPIPEQKRIVAVLETWDQAIEKLARKIEIKEKIKKGLMQQLLTGKVRLPGFTDDWHTVKLGDISKVIMGQSPSSSFYNEIGDGIPLIQGNNDIKKRKTIARIWTSSVTKSAELGSIIMTVRAPVGLVGLATEKVCLGRGVCGIIPEKADKDYVFKFLESYESMWKSLEQGSTFSAVNSSDIRGLEIKMPILKDEQEAIADILTTVDQDIDGLMSKQRAFEIQKKYLLNNLITGAIRTPENLKIYDGD